MIGVALNALRANVDAIAVTSGLLEATAEESGHVVRVHVHPGVMSSEEPHRRQVARWLRAHEDELELIVRPPLPQNEFRDLVYGLDLAVLPYRFGTHSGWLEACVDAGTRVLSPAHGCYSDQHHGLTTYRMLDGRMVEPAATVAAALAAPAVSLNRAQREHQRRDLARAHREIYLSAVDSSGNPADQR